MPRGDKSKYTEKQKRQAEHIEEGYEVRGVPEEEEAERRAWATVNKMTGGGKKPGGSGRGKPVNKARHWMSPASARCTQCGARHPYSKHSQTLGGKLEDIFQRVGRAVVLGGAALVVLLLLAGGFYAYRYFSGAASAAEQSAHVATVVNSSFDVSKTQPASFQVVVPPGATNARVVGGYKVIRGGNVHFYILEQSQYQQWSAGAASFQPVAAKEKSSSARLRQVLKPGTYHLLFAHNGSPLDTLTVAAEFYLKYD